MAQTATSVRLTSYARKLRANVVVVAPNDLDKKDIELFFDILVMRFALLHDLVGSTPGSEKILDSWERTILGLKSIDVELYTRDWKTLREILTSVEFRTELDACAACFKRMSQGRIHYKWILGSALRLLEVTGSYKKVNQWIVFDSKANFVSLDLTTACCTEYLDFESRIDDNRRYATLPLVQRCARDLFGDFNITNYPFRPRHGNGATAEVKRRDADSWHKNRQFAVDGEVINYLRYRLAESEWRDSLYMPYRGLNRQSILVCVPKSMTKNRTISKEPTTLQFLQQDVYKALDDYFVEHPECHIDLHDQATSRHLALLGSADGSYATIDLSCASDSVSVRTVEAVFDGLPVLYPLMATRSDTVYVSDRSGSIDVVVRTRKFAPMGSATCFPTETMVFTCLCEAAVRLETGRRSRNLDYVVYGDDIVIRSCYAARLLLLLEEFGFVVNSEKSFYDRDGVAHHFREACGIEAFDGEDITPLRLSRRLVSPTFNDSDHQAGLAVGLLDLQNRVYLYGYKVLHRWLNDVLREHYWYGRLVRISYSNYCEVVDDIANGQIPRHDLATPFVLTDDLCDTQWKAMKRRSILSSPVQRSEVFVYTAKTRPRRLHYDSNDYYSWWVKTALQSDAVDEYVLDATGIVTLRPRDLRWVKTWVPIFWASPHYLRLRPAE